MRFDVNVRGRGPIQLNVVTHTRPNWHGFKCMWPERADLVETYATDEAQAIDLFVRKHWHDIMAQTNPDPERLEGESWTADKHNP